MNLDMPALNQGDLIIFCVEDTRTVGSLTAVLSLMECSFSRAALMSDGTIQNSKAEWLCHWYLPA